MKDDCDTTTALTERVAALDRLMEARFNEFAARLESHNQFREQINDERRDYVTRKEIGWLIVTIIAMIGIVVAFFSARIQ